MRLKSEIWVKAYIRRLNGAGVMAMLVKHGDDDAGAIFIKIATLDRKAALYGPAPAGHAAMGEDRRWVCLMPAATSDEHAVDERLRREREFDSDIWIVEVEDRLGRHFLDDWLAKG